MKSGALVVLVLAALVASVAVVALAEPRWRHRLPKVTGLTAGGLLAAYLVGRGIAEFHVTQKQEV